VQTHGQVFVHFDKNPKKIKKNKKKLLTPSYLCGILTPSLRKCVTRVTVVTKNRTLTTAYLRKIREDKYREKWLTFLLTVYYVKLLTK